MIYGEGQDDDLIGGDGSDILFGGAGVDGIAGDNGRFATSRNGQSEPLMGLADEIVVMDDGQVVDQGTHEDLMARCSMYQKIRSSNTQQAA